PNMDLIASRGVTGLLKTIPPKSSPGTEVAFMSIFGYDPRRVNPGRGPLEAAGIGVDLGEDDLALRCNLVTVADGVLKDHSAGHIPTEEARDLLQAVKEHHEVLGLVEFHLGVSYRHLLVLRDGKHSDRIVSTPPHDALNTPVEEILVKAVDEEGRSTAEMLNRMMLNSERLLKDHPVNRARIESGENPGNMIWPWGQGRRPRLRTLKETYGVKGAAISAVDIVNGIGRYLGMDIVKVPGATGYFDTNYEGKADYALKSLKDHDLVLVHVEAPDEASHAGDCNLKVKTIEDLDRRLLGRILQGLEEDYTIVVMADHTTQTSDGAHSRSPVPFAIYSPQNREGDRVKRFDEVSVKEGSLGVVEGVKFMELFLKQGGKPA
ncbi:MAG: cofactor-independent phosphoglycerate mutase, partial [Nitrososphaerales archaeon]